jgi:hypothetical protein
MLHAALKEWAVVCDLMLEGKLAILLRKGGIHEWDGPAVFKLEYDRFALWPSWAHQRPAMIKPQHRDRVQVLDEPEQVTLQAMAQAVRVWQVRSREAFDTLDDLHCWTRPQIDMRFDYKPEKPLWLLALRVSRLPSRKTVENTREYAGCRSWVPLSDADQVDEQQAGGPIPVLSEAQLQSIIDRVEAVM